MEYIPRTAGNRGRAPNKNREHPFLESTSPDSIFHHYQLFSRADAGLRYSGRSHIASPSRCCSHMPRRGLGGLCQDERMIRSLQHYPATCVRREGEPSRIVIPAPQSVPFPAKSYTLRRGVPRSCCALITWGLRCLTGWLAGCLAVLVGSRAYHLVLLARFRGTTELWFSGDGIMAPPSARDHQSLLICILHSCFVPLFFVTRTTYSFNQVPLVLSPHSIPSFCEAACFLRISLSRSPSNKATG